MPEDLLEIHRQRDQPSVFARQIVTMRKPARQIALLTLFLTVLSGCLDKTDHYSSLNDARSDRLFERGWLPDMLPPSTYDLEITTSVEVSSGHGRFHFDQGDYPPFSTRLSKYNGVMPKLETYHAAIQQLLEEGYAPNSYASGPTNWIFLCDQKKAVCEFFVWQ
ncbi:MAG: hypothetical protein E6Q88_10275 [Lysobacteraceae bacterium]|nr:MAG: hypothetical protein E6Q88_10275 [Xanthomonadaceae bacterium]